MTHPVLVGALIAFSAFSSAVIYLICGLLGLSHLRLFYCGMAIFIPVLGPILSLTMMINHRMRNREYAGHDTDWLYDYQPGVDTASEDIFFASSTAQLLQRELIVEPYFDIIRGQNTALKRALISRLMRQPSPIAISILREAVSDDSYGIRTYASSALQQIESQFQTSIVALKTKLRDAAQDADLRFDLVAAHLNYVESGLLETHLSRYYLRLTDSLLEGFKPDNLSHKLKIRFYELSAKSAHFTGNEVLQHRHVDALLKLDPKHRDALLQRCQHAFSTRDLITLKKTCLLLDDDAADPQTQEAVLYWTGAEQPA